MLQKKAKDEALHISMNNEKALKEAESITHKMRKEAIQEAEAIRADRFEKAKAEAEKLLDQARTAIEQEKKKALLELRAEVTKMAIEAATLILEEEIDEKRNKKIVEKYINELN